METVVEKLEKELLSAKESLKTTKSQSDAKFIKGYIAGVDTALVIAEINAMIESFKLSPKERT